MILPRASSAVLSLASFAASASAWSTGSSSRGTATSFVGRSILAQSPRPARSGSASRHLPTTTGRAHGMTMFFGKLFGGGAYENKIQYDALDFPGPELGTWALEGKVPASSEKKPNLELATFAGGCFWGLELAFQRVPGVEYTAVGYAQGPETEPTYGQVCSGTTGHTEAVMVYYDPTAVDGCSYDSLLDVFFGRVNPTTVNGQGNDFGTQYRTGVYFHTPEQEEAAKARFDVEKTKYGSKPIATELKAATPFWPAEKYHQQYLEKGGQDASKGATNNIRCYG